MIPVSNQQCHPASIHPDLHIHHHPHLTSATFLRQTTRKVIFDRRRSDSARTEAGTACMPSPPSLMSRSMPRRSGRYDCVLIPLQGKVVSPFCDVSVFERERAPDLRVDQLSVNSFGLHSESSPNTQSLPTCCSCFWKRQKINSTGLMGPLHLTPS